MILRTGPLPAPVAERLSRVMADAFAARERGWSAAEIAALAETPGVAILDADEAFAMIRTVAGEAELLTIAVAPAAQGRGVGRALLDQALARAAGAASRLFLEVGVTNDPARALYAAAGFRPAGRRKSYVRRADGALEDALILERPLGPPPASG